MSSFGSSLFNALSDPGVDALAGMAEGFARAAAPTRMPTPWGEALGMGAAGLLSGVGDSQRLQMARQQVQQAQLNNKMLGLYVNALPGAVGLATGSPGATATPPGGAPAGTSPAVSPAASPLSLAGNGYLVSPSEDVALRNLALMRGDTTAAATLNGQVQNFAGGPGYAVSGNGMTAMAVPGGAKDPRVLAANAAAAAGGQLPAQLAAKGFAIGPDGQIHYLPGSAADPAYQASLPRVLRPGGMLVANGQTLKNPELERTVLPDGTKSYSWMQPPEPAWSSTGGQPQQPAANADPFPLWAQRIDAVENSTGNPGATNPNSTATGNGQFINQTWLNTVQAVRPDLTQGRTPQQIMALRSNPALSLQITTAYARQGGAALAQNGLPITGGTVYLSHALGPTGAVQVLKANPNTPLAMMLPKSVIAANPQFQNGATAGDAVIWAQNRMRTQVPAPTNTADGRAAPVLGQNGQPAVAELSPGADDALKDYVGEDANAYEAAQNTQGWITQVLHSADVMTKAGSIYWTGPHAPDRLAAMASVNDMARSIGLTPPFNQSAVASWEEMRKATLTAGFELSSHYEGRARQAASVIENATSAVPGEKNSPVGLQLVAHGIREAAQSAIDAYNYKTQMYHQQGAQGLVGAEAAFYTKFPPLMYAQRAISTIYPVKISNPQQFSNYLPGTYATLPNGKLIQVPMRPGAPPVPTFLQQQQAGH